MHTNICYHNDVSSLCAEVMGKMFTCTQLNHNLRAISLNFAQMK